MTSLKTTAREWQSFLLQRTQTWNCAWLCQGYRCHELTACRLELFIFHFRLFWRTSAHVWFYKPSMKTPSFIVLALKATLYQLWARIAAITKRRRISVIYMKKSQRYLPPPSSLEWPGATDARANRAQGVPRYDACWRPALSWSKEQGLRSVGMGTIVFLRISAQALVKNFG